MAGAISAGAYTAGAIDYLLEALDEWERQKRSGRPDVPMHQVEIPVIGGASAGGMTALMAAAALQEDFEPVRRASDQLFAPIPTNRFYHSWVDLVSEDMFSVMLDPGDLASSGLTSLLNSDFIEQIADRALQVDRPSPLPRRYIPPGLKVFVTLSNLRGMDYSLAFRSGLKILDRYHITTHQDYACFRMVEKEEEYQGDGWMPLNLRSGLHRQQAKDAAMATGAFPGGLRARTLTRQGRYLNDLDWFHYITKEARNPFPDQPCQTVHVDGGLINNEPFEQVRRVLQGLTGQRDPQDIQSYDRFQSTVLMVDPFPSSLGRFKSSLDLGTILPNTLEAMTNQSRVKPANLIEFMASDRAGQFLLSPVRYLQKDGRETFIEGAFAIACGAMGGFGGFLHKSFRIHDYFLGRANCERFLREYFTVPANTTNEIFVQGYAQVADKRPFTAADGNWQIIPIFGKAADKPYLPTFEQGGVWPVVSADVIRRYRRPLKRRVGETLLHAAEYKKWQSALIWLGGRLVINGKIADSVLDNILHSLDKHGLLT